MGLWSRFVLKHSLAIVLMGLILGVLGTVYSIKLYENLRTEIEELLPRNARSVKDLSEIKGRLESTNNLTILVFSSHVEKSKQFVIDLATELRKLPKQVAAGVEYRIDQELSFFQKRSALFIETEDLKRLNQFIHDKIAYETELYNPLTFLLNKSIKEPELDFQQLQKKYSDRAGEYTRFKEGLYATPDEKIRAILVNLPGSAGGISGSKKLRQEVDRVIEHLNPKKYATDLEVHFTGGTQDMIEEHEALVEDLTLSTCIVTILVVLSMILYFRSISSTVALILGLFVATLCTFGINYFLIGYLNANSAFMGSIVLGNGINFGIILIARFLEERRKQKNVARSVAIAIEKTRAATAVAAAAAALSYGSLMLTSFRGFRQFGIIGFIGMVLCWVSSYTLLPALLLILDRLRLHRHFLKPRPARIARLIATAVQRFSFPIIVITSGLTIVSLLSLHQFNNEIIETDLLKLRNVKSMRSGSIYWGKYQDQVFDHYLSPIVILPTNRATAQQIANEVKKIRESEGENSFISTIRTIDDFVPRDQLQKVKTLKNIQTLLTQPIISQLDPEKRKLTQELLSPQARLPFSITELPEMILSKFREKTGAVGNLVLIEPTLNPELSRIKNLIHFVRNIREATDRVSPGVAVAGTLPVTADLFESILHDAPKAILFAWFAVFALIAILFRDALTIGLCSFSLFLGVLWLLGYILIFHLKINFLNFIALPITFGIGVDYGINIFQRYRHQKSKDILKVIQETGGAVMLASLTTIIGYGSLLIASNQAFVSFGRLAIMGELTCVFSAVVSLPALLWYIRSKKRNVLT